MTLEFYYHTCSDLLVKVITMWIGKRSSVRVSAEVQARKGLIRIVVAALLNVTCSSFLIAMSLLALGMGFKKRPVLHLYCYFYQRPINRTDWPLDEIPYYLAANCQNLTKCRLKISPLLNTIFRRNIHHTMVYVIVFRLN